MEKMQDLTALLKHEVEDLISAEDQIIKAMPAMIENATNASLKKSLRDHLRVTQNQRKRLDKVQKLLGGGKENSPGEKKGFLSNLFGGMSSHECKGMKGIIEEGEKIMAEDMVAAVKDAAIIASTQKVEHYEICGYGTAKAYAIELNLNNVAKLLEETLNEEYDADKLLTKLAESEVNEKAEGKNGRVSRSSSSIKKTGTNTSSSNGTLKKPAPAAKSSNGSPAKATVKKAAAKKSAAKPVAKKSAAKSRK